MVSQDLGERCANSFSVTRTLKQYQDGMDWTVPAEAYIFR